MIDFMVLGVGRCGTAWAANWLTTETTICIHEPLFIHSLSALDEMRDERLLGISCTGSWLFTDWMDAQAARKVVLHRPVSEINESLRRIGIKEVANDCDDALWRIKGMHVDWRDMWGNPRPIYEFLLQKEFDERRHAQLAGLNVQYNFKNPRIDVVLQNELIKQLRSIVKT